MTREETVVGVAIVSEKEVSTEFTSRIQLRKHSTIFCERDISNFVFCSCGVHQHLILLRPATHVDNAGTLINVAVELVCNLSFSSDEDSLHRFDFLIILLILLVLKISVVANANLVSTSDSKSRAAKFL